MKLEDLYRQVIMDHYKNPRNKGLVKNEDYKEVHLHNPSCGDDITIEVKIEDAYKDNPSVVSSSKLHAGRDDFLRKIDSLSFEEQVEKFLSTNNIENINPSEDVNLSDKYVISEGKGVTVLGFEPEYAVVSDNGEITIYGDDSMLVVTGNMVHMPDGTIIDFKVSPVSIQVLVNGAIAMIFRR